MSYTFLQASGGESSVECFSDIPASARLKLTHFAGRSFCNVNAMESFHDSQFGMMSSLLTRDHGADSQTLCVVETTVRQTVMLPVMVFPLRVWERSFYAASKKCIRKRCLEKILTQLNGMLPGLPLDLGTPWNHSGMKPLLSNAGHVVWELSTTKCAHGSLAFRSPNARDWKGMSARSWRERAVGDKTPTLPDQIGGVPHPEFLEDLMGWPIGWTELKPLEMASFRQWLELYCPD